MNRSERRAIDRMIPDEAIILIAAISERANIPVDDLRTAFVRTPEHLWNRKVLEMRDWVNKFDAGEIVWDNEVEKASAERKD